MNDNDTLNKILGHASPTPTSHLNGDILLVIVGFITEVAL